MGMSGCFDGSWARCIAEKGVALRLAWLDGLFPKTFAMAEGAKHLKSMIMIVIGTEIIWIKNNRVLFYISTIQSFSPLKAIQR